MKIFVADAIAEEGLALLRESGFTTVVETGLSEAALCQRISDCEAVIVRSATFITESVIAAGRALRVIGRAGVGVDNIDVAAATERGIVVLNTPDANATTTAELTLAHLLSLSRHLPAADRSMRAGRWERSRFLGTEVAGKVLGVIGYGTIGRIVAARCLGLTMRVLAHDPFVTESTLIADGVEPASLDRVLAEADFLTLHCPLTDKTRGFINAKRLVQMKLGARLINCARGELLDEQALLIALESGHLAGAALDVFAQEPPTGSALLSSDKLVFTPHLGASTQEAQVAVGVAVARRVANYLSRGEAINAVNLPHVPTEEMQRIRPYQDLAR
ncbi:MAG: hydroxyacid dehydrogenase, partial [Gammaproteobacteria bacterium]